MRKLLSIIAVCLFLIGTGAEAQNFQILNGPNVTKCDNDSLVLRATTGAAFSNYNWFEVGNPVSLGTADTLLVTTVISFGQFFAVTADSAGFPVSDTTFVFPLASPAVDLGLDTFICPGDSVTLQDLAIAGPLYTYQWSTGASTSSIKVGNGGDYWLKITGPFPNTCSGRDTIFVDQRPALNLNPISDQNVCSGESLQLNLSFADPGTPPYQIQWEPAGIFNDPTVLNPIADVTSDTTISVAVEDNGGSGCTDSLSFKAYVFPNLTVGVQFSDTTICAGDTIQLFSITSGGTPGATGFSYSWTPNTGIVDNTVANPLVFPGNSTTYVVDVTDSIGCNDTSSVSLNVDNPMVTILNPDTTFVCPGDTVQVNTQISNQGNNPVFQWQPSGGPISDPSIAEPQIFGTGDFSLTMTIESGCTSTDFLSVRNSPPSNITVSGPQNSNVCLGSSVPFTAAVTGGTAPFTYVWYEEGAPVDTSASNVYNLNTLQLAPGAFVVSAQAFDVANCPSDIDTAQINLISGPAVSISSPSGPVVVQEPVNFSISSGSFDSLVWDFGDGNTGVSSGNTITHTYNSVGTFTTYVFAYADACPGIDSVLVEVLSQIQENLIYIPTAFSSNSEDPENRTLKVYGTTLSDQNFSFRVYSTWGNQVYESRDLIQSTTEGWTGDGYPLGVYVVKCSGEFLDGTKFDITETVNLIR